MKNRVYRNAQTACVTDYSAVFVLAESAFDPVFAFLDDIAGQPDRWEAGSQVHFDFNQTSG